MTTIDINSLNILQALKFFLLKELHRHEQDIMNIKYDLNKLRHVNIPIGLDYDAWYEVAPEKGTGAPETSTQTTQMRGKNTQYESKGEG